MLLGTMTQAAFQNSVAAGGSSRTEIGVTAYGDAQVDTAKYKFGTGSLLCDGTGDGLKTDDAIDMTNGEWTFECWYYNNNTFVGGDTDVILDPRINLGNGYTNLIFAVTNGYIGFYTNSWKNSSTQMTSGQWNHLAWSWDGTNIRAFVNGTLHRTAADSRTYYDCGVSVGARYDVGAFYTNGWIDEVRISNVCRYTSAFTAPSAAFTNDADTTLLLHMDGSDGSTTFTDDYT